MATDRIVVGEGQTVDFGFLIRDLRRVDKALPKVIQQANKALAEDVASIARSGVSSLPGAAPGMVRGRATDGIRARAGQQRAAVALLGSNPYVRAFEFGTAYHFIPNRRGSGRKIPAVSMVRRVFPPWIGNQFSGGEWKDGLHGKSGHLVAPAVQRGIDTGNFSETYADYIDRAFALAFPEAA